MNDDGQNHKGLTVALTSVTTLFFAWGFITSLIDPLIPSVRAIFSLSYAESMLTQSAYFIAYGVVSLPAAAMVARAGYSRSILIALFVMIAGCAFMPVATHLNAYPLVLLALFIIASGVTVLQVAANPLAAALGKPERSHLRLTLSQAFNSLGTVLGPYFGALIMLQGGVFAAKEGMAEAAHRNESLRNIDTSFLMIVVLLALLMLLIFWSRRRINAYAPAPTHERAPVLNALKSRWALLGAAAIFLYVGAEVSIGSLMINFLHQPDVLDVTLAKAGTYLSLYWLGAMVGRFVGTGLLARVSAPKLLMIAAAVAALLCLTVSQIDGALAGWAALSIGLFNSIMFPVIFTVTLERSTASLAATSGLLCVAIVGGAVLPPIVGRIADTVGLHAAFVVPMIAYVLISVFAFGAARARIASTTPAVREMAH